MALLQRRSTYYKDIVLNPFKDGAAATDIPFLIDGGYTSNKHRGICASMKDQMTYCKAVTDFTTPLDIYITPIFNIALSSINTLRVISNVNVSGITYEIYQASYMEHPSNDLTKTTYSMDATVYPLAITQVANVAGIFNFAEVINLIALPYVFFVIKGLKTAGYTAKNGLMMYLHTELSP